MTREEREKRKKEQKEQFINDVNSCIRVLETLKQFDSMYNPNHINSAKVTRARLVIHDILKKY